MIHMTVTVKNGAKGTLTIDGKAQAAVLNLNGVSHLIAYIRDNKVKIKSDLFLNESDLSYVRAEMNKFVKVATPAGKKRK